MAKSKNGGSRAYIRGRLGSDVYSVGKNAEGKKQQVVRSLAESVSNPRTTSQMFGRMVMSTVMQAVSALKPIIDHSFDGLPSGQPSISEFIRRNYALIKADAIAHPSSGNVFGLNSYQEKGIQLGAYNVSAGEAVLPSAVQTDEASFFIALTAETLTVGGLKAALGLSTDGYLTYVGVRYNGETAFVRVRLTTTLSDDTAITNENVASLFTMDGSVTPTVSVANNNVIFAVMDESASVASAVIVSEKVNGAWIHNNATLKADELAGYPADSVLPTYPVGTEMFLNGGEL